MTTSSSSKRSSGETRLIHIGMKYNRDFISLADPRVGALGTCFPYRSNSLSFSCIFSKLLTKLIGWRPNLWGWCPLGNPGSAAVFCQRWNAVFHSQTNRVVTAQCNQGISFYQTKKYSKTFYIGNLPPTQEKDGIFHDRSLASLT